MFRSPSQSTTEFDSFLSGFEDLLCNALCSKSHFSVILGYFNARSPTWWSKDIATLSGTQISSLTTTHGFKQIISDLTHKFSMHVNLLMLIIRTMIPTWNSRLYRQNWQK